MSSARAIDDCARFSCSMGAYVDGELDAGHAMDIEGHVDACACCAEQVAMLRATRVSLKRTCGASAPAAFRARLSATLVEERCRAAVYADSDQHAMVPKLIRLRYAVGLVAAAGIVFAMGLARNRPFVAERDVLQVRPELARAGFDTLLDELVSLHAVPMDPEMTNPEELQRFDPVVGVPVRRPPFQPFGANFRGARVNAFSGRRAALLQYTVHGGHRITVYVFDTRNISMQATRLERRDVRERFPAEKGRLAQTSPSPRPSVYVGSVSGYTIAAGERSGVGYALASDLDSDQNAQMVLAALEQ